MASRSHSELHTPLTFANGATAPNRLWLAPMTNRQSHEDGILSDAEFHWLVRRAQGSFGVVETCAAYVALHGKGWGGELGIDRDDCLDGLRRLATALTEHRSCGIVQLFHGGARSPKSLSGNTPVSASDLDPAPRSFEVSRAASEEEIQSIIGSFALAAVRAEKACFQGVELHGAHGYLLCQFISSVLNRREDRWGGSLENRARLLRECLQAVRKAVRPDFVVGVRLSPENLGPTTGLDLDESVQIAKWLVEDGADFIHVSLWDGEKPSQKYPDEHPLPRFRQALSSRVPIIAAGGVWSVDQALRLMDHGADAIAIGRAAIANPDWPIESRNPDWTPRRPPLTPDELQARGLSPIFVEYMRNWKGFVTD